MNVRLTTIGRKTGHPREIPLYAFADGDRLVIVGSRGGAAKDPAWVDNLRAEPRAAVRVGSEERQVTAREIGNDDVDRERWSVVVAAFPPYATFQARTERTIPLFVLEVVAG